MNHALSLTDIQKCELGILEKAVEMFDKHDVHYLLAYGTMLGAVRHNGFIPWDDDIDIFVPRADYEKLKRLLREGWLGVEYLSYGIPGDEGYPYPFIKILDKRYLVDDKDIKKQFHLNLWIDVFPLDHLPNEREIAASITIETGKYMNLLGLEIAERENTRNIKYYLKSVFAKAMGGYRGVARYIDRRAQKINDQNASSKVMGNIVWPQYRKDFFEVDQIVPTIVHDFCGDQFMIPQNYHEHLNYLYGDYLQLPPEEKRQRHFITVFREP